MKSMDTDAEGFVSERMVSVHSISILRMPQTSCRSSRSSVRVFGPAFFIPFRPGFTRPKRKQPLRRRDETGMGLGFMSSSKLT